MVILSDTVTLSDTVILNVGVTLIYDWVMDAVSDVTCCHYIKLITCFLVKVLWIASIHHPVPVSGDCPRVAGTTDTGCLGWLALHCGTITWFKYVLYWWWLFIAVKFMCVWPHTHGKTHIHDTYTRTDTHTTHAYTRAHTHTHTHTHHTYKRCLFPSLSLSYVYRTVWCCLF